MSQPERNPSKQPDNVEEQSTSEASSNPHSGAEVRPTPVRTDPRLETRSANTGKSPSTAGGQLHPSVAEGVEGDRATLGVDSMFNQADPQTAELQRGQHKNHARVEERSDEDDKKAA